MIQFSRIGIVVKQNDESVANTVHDVLARLESLGSQVMLEHGIAALVPGRATVDIDTLGQHCDLAVVIGGDGTLLHSARALVSHDISLVGVNRGRLGFLVDVSPDAGLDQLNGILEGSYVAEERLLLRTRMLRDGQPVSESLAFNDTVIRVHEVLQIMDFDVLIDDVLVSHQRADGIVIATPSGSTAYSLSIGGPIVGPTIDAMVIQPISPHTLNSRPLIVPADSRIRVHLWDDQMLRAQVVCDGQNYMEATLGDMIEVQRFERKVRLLHPETYDYHRILREKLRWS